MDRCTVRLTALEGEPLVDARVRATVLATASAIAERTGVELVSIDADGSSVTVTLGADRIAGLGFLAELRRLTNAWYEGKHHGGPLWGIKPDADGEWEPPSEWKPE
jgi:hypothetical protein